MNNGTMKLQKYLDLNKISQRQAARELGIKRPYLNAIANGRANPGRELTKKIRAWSEGAIQTKDLPGWEDFE